MNSGVEGLQRFVRVLEQAETLEEVSACLAGATRWLRFDHYLLCLRREQACKSPITLTDLPSPSGEGAIAAAAARRIRPFYWDKLLDRPTATKAGTWVVPLHMPEIASGHCSFLMRDGKNLAPEYLPDAQYLATFAFETVERLSREKPPVVRQRLSRRQLDCVLLAARGKSDWVAAQILGLQPDTVHKYLEQAKNRYGVSTRTELVVRALYDGQIHFRDLLD